MKKYIISILVALCVFALGAFFAVHFTYQFLIVICALLFVVTVFVVKELIELISKKDKDDNNNHIGMCG